MCGSLKDLCDVWAGEPFCARPRCRPHGGHIPRGSPIEGREGGPASAVGVPPDDRVRGRPPPVRRPAPRLHEALRPPAGRADRPPAPCPGGGRGELEADGPRAARDGRPPRDADVRAGRPRGPPRARGPAVVLPLPPERPQLPVARLRAARPAPPRGRAPPGPGSAVPPRLPGDREPPAPGDVLRDGGDGGPWDRGPVRAGAAGAPREGLAGGATPRGAGERDRRQRGED